MANLNDWWSSLTIAQKERIATKVANTDPEQPVHRIYYPDCTRWWIALSPEHQQQIHDHCTDHHGYLLADWKQGYPLSY
ncbi:MAG: hypothetical protein MJZ89_01405 [Paludibacteraceae bacterium]|nr:hypothetical protein [Paludibacteraceae bacterium]